MERAALTLSHQNKLSRPPVRPTSAQPCRRRDQHPVIMGETVAAEVRQPNTCLIPPNRPAAPFPALLSESAINASISSSSNLGEADASRPSTIMGTGASMTSYPPAAAAAATAAAAAAADRALNELLRGEELNNAVSGGAGRSTRAGTPMVPLLQPCG